MACEVVEAGAAGITFGRNIWQSPRLEGMIHALKTVVHRGMPVDEAMALLGAG